MSEADWDVVVVGGSAAGLSAALMLGRARRRTVVVDSGQPRNRFAAHMHGVLGHDGRNPAELVAAGRREVSRYGVELVDGSVKAVVERAGGGLEVALSTGETLRCRAVIVASGFDDVLPDVPGLAERWGKTVLHCPYCHGWEVGDRRLGVLVTSPLGLHLVQLVRQWSDQVVFFGAAAGPLDTDTERRLAARDIDLVTSPVVEVGGDPGAACAVRTADGRTVEVDALFSQTTPHPRDRFLAGLKLDRRDTPFGSFLAVDATGKTSHPMIWAVGNVADPAANVPVSMSAGGLAGAMVNMVLVDDDFDAAVAEPIAGARR